MYSTFLKLSNHKGLVPDRHAPPEFKSTRQGDMDKFDTKCIGDLWALCPWTLMLMMDKLSSHTRSA